MKNFLVVLMFLYGTIAYAQTDVYSLTSGEMIFSNANMTNNGTDVNTDMRFTVFFHVGEYIHADFTNNIGLFTGMALRNVGIMTKDSYNDPINNPVQDKVVRRSYSVGVPLALKLGVFDKGAYIFGGGEYEMMFHYKEKYWIGDQKYKSTEWFSSKTNLFVPSLFAGVQFPGGLHVKFKYYMGDFLSDTYKDSSSDYTKITESKMFHLSLSLQFRPDQLWKKMEGGFSDSASR